MSFTENAKISLFFVEFILAQKNIDFLKFLKVYILYNKTNLINYFLSLFW